MNVFERVAMHDPGRLDEVSFPLAHKYLSANFPHIKTKDIPMILNHYLGESGLRVFTNSDAQQDIMAELEDFLVKQTEAYKKHIGTKADDWFSDLLSKAKEV